MPAKKQKSFVPSIKSVKSPSKRRIIVGLFVIAILGGIALVLRSFAAAPYTLVSYIPNGTLNIYGSGSFSQGQNYQCNYKNIYDGGWKFDVAAIACAKLNSYQSEFVSATGKKWALTPGTWKVCAWALGVSKGVEVSLYRDNPRYELLRESYPVFNNSQYQYICTRATVRGSSNSYLVYANARIWANTESGSIVRIASVNLVRVSP